MIQILKIFFNAEKTKPWLVLFCLLAGGLAEAVGIGSILPLAGAMLGDKSTTSPLDGYFKSILSVFGLTPSFESLLLLLTIFMLLRSALLFFANTYSGIAAARVTIDLRQRLIRAIFRARWSFYNDQSGGDIANSISNNAGNAGSAYATAATVTAMLVQIMAYAAAAFFINWRVTLAGFIAGGLIALVSSRLIHVARKSGSKITNRVANFTSDMIDIMHNMKALKSMHRYDALVEKLGSQLKYIKRSLLQGNVAKAGLTYGSDAMTSVAIAASAYLAHRFANLSLPELMVFGLLFYQVIFSISRLQKQYQSAVQLESSYLAVIEDIKKAEAAQEQSEGTKAPNIMQGCNFENVSFAHGKQPTVSNLSFTIPANQITVLQGPSGAGKTTIIDLLIGFHKPQKGQIKIGNDDLQDIDLTLWRKNIGYVPQELVLFHDSIEANVSLSDLTVSTADVEKALDRAGAKEFIAALPEGLNTDVGEMGGKLSGGQKQRISLARALVKNPKLIILDEVTSALDPETEAEIVRNILELRRSYTIIAITHRPAWTAIADKLYKVEKGKIAELKKSKAKPK